MKNSQWEKFHFHPTGKNSAIKLVLGEGWPAMLHNCWLNPEGTIMMIEEMDRRMEKKEFLSMEDMYARMAGSDMASKLKNFFDTDNISVGKDALNRMVRSMIFFYDILYPSSKLLNPDAHREVYESNGKVRNIFGKYPLVINWKLIRMLEEIAKLCGLFERGHLEPLDMDKSIGVKRCDLGLIWV